MNLWATHLYAQSPREGHKWHCPDASICYVIEQDKGFAHIPDLRLTEINPKRAQGPSGFVRRGGRNRNRQTFIDSQLFYDSIGMYADGFLIYKIPKQCTRFVSRIALDGRDEQKLQASFLLFIDEQKVFESSPMTRAHEFRDVNIKIPYGAKEIVLVNQGLGKQRRRRTAQWINPGFQQGTRGPGVCAVQLCVTGLDPCAHDYQVFNQYGKRVNSRAYAHQPDEAVKILFDTSSGTSRPFYVYVVPKSQTEVQPDPWMPPAQVTLETRHLPVKQMKCPDLDSFYRLWQQAQPVGFDVVDSLHQGFARHRRRPANRDASAPGHALYVMRGYFTVKKAGKHSFATASKWGSAIVIDGKPLGQWFDKPSLSAARKRKYQASIQLNEGIHEIEYVNWAPWSEMLAMVAWQRPGRNMRPMTRSDFVPGGRFAVTARESHDTGSAPGAFVWRTKHDIRLQPERADMVCVEFRALTQPPLPYSFEWTFDDGHQAQGPLVEHVFLRPGAHSVTLTVKQDDRDLHQLTQAVYVDALWQRYGSGLHHLDAYTKALGTMKIPQMPLPDQVALFEFAEQAQAADLKEKVVIALLPSVDRLAQHSSSGQKTVLGLALYLSDTQVQRHDEALALYEKIRAHTDTKQTWAKQAALEQARLLTLVLNQPDRALQVLNALGQAGALKKQFTLVKAHTLWALGRPGQAADLLGALAGKPGPAPMHVQHQGLLRSARLLLQNPDPEQQAYAMDKVQQVLDQDPTQLLDPAFNLLRIDSHLALGEKRIALNLCAHMEKLDLNELAQTQLLLRRLKVLCQLRELDQAQQVYQSLQQDYGYSSVLGTAKQVLSQALNARQK